jgi:hypothetical protein
LPGSIARFDVDLAGTNTALADGLKFGLWLTDNPDYARQYGPTVLAVEVPENINLKRFSSWDELEREINEYDSPEEFVSALLKNGFQGVITFWVGGVVWFIGGCSCWLWFFRLALKTQRSTLAGSGKIQGRRLLLLVGQTALVALRHYTL